MLRVVIVTQDGPSPIIEQLTRALEARRAKVTLRGPKSRPSAVDLASMACCDAVVLCGEPPAGALLEAGTAFARGAKLVAFKVDGVVLDHPQCIAAASVAEVTVALGIAKEREAFFDALRGFVTFEEVRAAIKARVLATLPENMDEETREAECKGLVDVLVDHFGDKSRFGSKPVARQQIEVELGKIMGPKRARLEPDDIIDAFCWLELSEFQWKARHPSQR